MSWHDYGSTYDISDLISPCFVCPAGWGGLGGYVYQKAYLEFFCSKEKLNALVERCKAFPLVTYMAVNRGGSWTSNVALTDVNAVTWGVFPAKEIIQPTVVDPTSFSVWKDEAFEIWSRGWATLYQEADPSRTLLEEVDVFINTSLVCIYFMHSCTHISFVNEGFRFSNDPMLIFAGAEQLLFGQLGR